MSKQDYSLTVEASDRGGSTFTLREVCERGECHAEFVIKLVDYGIVSPLQETREARQWQFDIAALSRLRKATRLQRDLKINLPGLAMSLELLDELDEMRRELARVHDQLRHLTED